MRTHHEWTGTTYGGASDLRNGDARLGEGRASEEDGGLQSDDDGLARAATRSVAQAIEPELYGALYVEWLEWAASPQVRENLVGMIGEGVIRETAPAEMYEALLDQLRVIIFEAGPNQVGKWAERYGAVTPFAVYLRGAPEVGVHGGRLVVDTARLFGDVLKVVGAVAIVLVAIQIARAFTSGVT